MINGPKVVIPPLGTLEWETVSKLLLALPQEIRVTYEIENINANQNHDLGSRNASLTWSHFHSWLSTPC
jgi:hypothetical protein